MNDDLVLPHYARYRNIDQAAKNDRDHDCNRCQRLQMEPGQADNHHFSEEKGKQEDKSEGELDECRHPSICRLVTAFRANRDLSLPLRGLPILEADVRLSPGSELAIRICIFIESDDIRVNGSGV